MRVRRRWVGGSIVLLVMGWLAGGCGERLSAKDSSPTVTSSFRVSVRVKDKDDAASPVEAELESVKLIDPSGRVVLEGKLLEFPYNRTMAAVGTWKAVIRYDRCTFLPAEKSFQVVPDRKAEVVVDLERHQPGVAGPSGSFTLRTTVDGRPVRLADRLVQVRDPAGCPVQLVGDASGSARPAAVFRKHQQPASAGTWTVLVAPGEESGVEAGERTFEVKQGKHTPVLIELASKKGRVQLRGAEGTPIVLTDPRGQRVVGKLPYQGEVHGGPWHLRAELANGKVFRRTFYVWWNEPVKLEVTDPGPTSHIILAGTKVPIDAGIKVVTFEEPGGLSFPEISADAVKKGRDALYAERQPDGKPLNGTIEELRREVRQVVLHTDLTVNSQRCFHALIGRGLSSHFFVDWDGAIYQPLDVRFEAKHAGPLSPRSIAIDLNNRMHNLQRKPSAPAYPVGHPALVDAASRRKYRRPKSVPMEINGVRLQAYGYTDAQYEALEALLAALVQALPELLATAPHDDDGEVLPGVIADPAAFSGILAHWHSSRSRWDPGPGFDWQRILVGLAARGLAPEDPQAGLAKPQPIAPSEPRDDKSDRANYVRGR